MRNFVYIMVDSSLTNIHCGKCSDVVKMLALYESVPTLFTSEEDKINRLVYLEEHLTDNEALKRFNEINSMDKKAKQELINSVNPNYIELIPGKTIEL